MLRTHNSQLADAAKDAGVIALRDYAILQNHGYMGMMIWLFGSVLVSFFSDIWHKDIFE